MGRRTHVVVRLRPSEGSPTCVDVKDDKGKEVVVADMSGIYAISIPHIFRVDQVLDERCSNEELFEKLVYDRILSSAEQPDTSCFLAYGHTNSGKTHTIAGGRREAGLLSLAARAVLDMYGYLEVAMIEVYGENVHDLLAQGERRLIRRRAGPDGVAIIVEDLTTCSLSTLQEWEAVSAFGMETRRTAPTERNSRSSRSHALFTIKSRGLRLCMVDLAGSERQTTYSPQLNNESIAINKSLSRLSTVLEALSTIRRRPDGSSSYVNFRDTTLTVLLQRYLCGASMTVFVACIHPDVQFVQETMSTMRYTQRLKHIKTKPPPQKPNDDSSLFHPKEHKNLLEELLALRKIVGINPCAGVAAGNDDTLKTKLYQDNCAPPAPPQDAAPRVEGPDRSERSIMRHKQRLLRSKDIRRVAGWLVSRTLSMLPQLSVGFDDYFDDYLPGEIQVVGYVSLMACLPPCSKTEALNGLAFLDVGDPSIGLSMLDAGIPACVGLHKLSCKEVHSWEVHEYNETNNIFLLAFFKVDEQLVEPLGASGSPFACCGGLLTLEPLMPLALVFGAPLNAPNEVKENVLQHLVTLQSEQHQPAGASNDTDASQSVHKKSNDSHGSVPFFNSEVLDALSDYSYHYEVGEDSLIGSPVGPQRKALTDHNEGQNGDGFRSQISWESVQFQEDLTEMVCCRAVGSADIDEADDPEPSSLSSPSTFCGEEKELNPVPLPNSVAVRAVSCDIDPEKGEQSPQSVGEQIITDSADQCDVETLDDQPSLHAGGDESEISFKEVELTVGTTANTSSSPGLLESQPKSSHILVACEEENRLDCPRGEILELSGTLASESPEVHKGKGKKTKRENRDNHRDRDPVKQGCHYCVIM
ncbi:kinesin, putative [Trypanosoma equiperdum]|uniref:Kinesin, putative n=1 Tax=Trypanosoma equiperdum TaxID=5694 RepID=A0A1G4I0C4_TRYEQ|nr:kinesin, putative [Trypanosoma equiperdum]